MKARNQLIFKRNTTMSISTRSQSRNPPMTPPQSHSGDLQEGFQQLIQHNASTSFPSQNQSQQQSNYSNTFDTDDDTLSSAPSSFGSSYHPSPEEDASFYDAAESPFTYGDINTGLGISYEGQGSPTPLKRETPYGNVVDDDSIVSDFDVILKLFEALKANSTATALQTCLRHHPTCRHQMSATPALVRPSTAQSKTCAHHVRLQLTLAPYRQRQKLLQ